MRGVPDAEVYVAKPHAVEPWAARGSQCPGGYRARLTGYLVGQPSHCTRLFIDDTIGDMPTQHSRISARVSAISESATLAVDAKAKALKAAGRPVIGFGAGEPDFPTPDYIVAAAQRACAVPRFHKYTPAAGLPELREAIAAKTARDSGYDASASQVLVTNGGKHAVAHGFAALLEPGDEVLMPAPYWTTYPESIT